MYIGILKQLRRQFILKIKVCMVLISSLLMSSMVFGADGSNINSIEQKYTISGNVSISKSDENVFTNPYNTMKFTATAQDNNLTILSGSKKINVQLNSPLFKLSEVYKDKIMSKDGLWGVERNIKKIVFDGSEDWTLINDYKFKNSNTSLFSTELPDNLRLKSGLCSHFDVSFDIAAKSNIYDGVSFDGNKVYVRIMNVRNVTDTDLLQKYLINQKKNGNPVTLYYIDETPEFEPFSDEIQNEFNSIDFSHVGFVDKLTPNVGLENEKIISNTPFSDKNNNSIGFDAYSALSAIKNISIFDSLKTDKIWVEAIIPQDDKCLIKINKLTDDNELKVLYGEFSYKNIDFAKSKETDLNFYESGNSNIKATVVFDFSKFFVPHNDITGLTFEQTGLNSDCILEKELVIPEKIPVIKGESTGIYFNNILINSLDINNFVLNSLKDEFALNKDSVTYTSNESDSADGTKLSLNYNNKDYNSYFINVSKDAGEGLNKTVLFIGDSITNENYYTKYVSQLFQDDSMKVDFIGTRGEKGANHEGRGGWSSYDYCNLTSLYGFDNPFLNNGKFDFSYYMKNNGIIM